MTLAPPTSLKESVVLCRQGHKPLALLVVLARELGVACGGNHTHKTTPTSSSSSRILIFANTKETTLRYKFKKSKKMKIFKNYSLCLLQVKGRLGAF